ncbi:MULTISPECIES: DUF423 domain-containing protein [unclassified Pasteurella]|uniref:DUF423 domain-containing protein n=1 Tax=unclassified Pasteurella TaxID=2621516 RepID=UPI001073A251|nr:DUF423 domain-containing protein [Pasteurella sp. 19428wF3_WM03]TFU51092.1 DUF423 domain-containing protein [Pasteurella sp. WM03]
MKNKWLFIAALSGFFGVALGAFAAHGLTHILDHKALEWIDTGLKYQLFHTLAILAVGLSVWQNDKFANLAAMAWSVGMVFFCGSLYALAFGVSKIVVWMTPIGGTLFLVGWFSLAYSSFKSKSE